MDFDIQINTKELITKKRKNKRKKNTLYDYEIETMREPEEWDKLYDNDT